ncbi:MAG: BrnA antitoxin family protein [Alphaproteobacteria bacterium]
MPKLKPNTYHNTPEEDAVITAAAMSDPDCMPLTDEEWERIMEKRRARLGRPPAAVTKKSVTIRLSRDVLEQFQAGGHGWQTRIDTALKEWLNSHSPAE